MESGLSANPSIAMYPYGVDCSSRGMVTFLTHFGNYGGQHNRPEGPGKRWNFCRAEHIAMELVFSHVLSSFGYG